MANSEKRIFNSQTLILGNGTQVTFTFTGLLNNVTMTIYTVTYSDGVKVSRTHTPVVMRNISGLRMIEKVPTRTSFDKEVRPHQTLRIEYLSGSGRNTLEFRSDKSEIIVKLRNIYDEIKKHYCIKASL